MLDMPSFLVEGPIPPTLNGPVHPSHKRSSLEKTLSPLSIQKDEGTRANGVGALSNGNSTSGMHPLPNGRRTEDETTAREINGENRTSVDTSSRRSSRALQEKERRSEDRPIPERLAPRDDGFFANHNVAKEEEGYFSTTVKLVTVDRHDGTQDVGDTPVDSSVMPTGVGTTEDSQRISNQAHRVSSPPTFSSPIPSTPIQIPRLQHRHTLEVPRLSTSRLSRDTTSSANATDDVVSATGRFSPSNATRGRSSLTLARRVSRSVHSDMHLDEVPQDVDTAHHTEVVRQKRMSRRRRKEEEEEDRVLVGTKVDQNHANYIMAYNMLTGIRFTVSRTNAKLDRELTDADFTARHKYPFDITGAELTPSAKYDFKFKDYAPWVFRHLRAIFKLDPADYLMSLTSKYILSELGSPGKSGSFFYFSRDYKYIIKTIHHAEHKVLRNMLKDYYNHVRENPNTLLSQFYGLHRVKIPFGRKVHFVIMNNLFPPHRDIHQTYDLKGSTVGRLFEEKNLETNPRATLKDLNWLTREKHLEFGPAKRKIFVQQMRKDVELLQKLKIMDYSLLVGIHDLNKGNEEQLRDKTLKVFQLGSDKDEENPQPPPKLTRTASKIETARKAKEMRQTLRQEKPVPMSETGSKMPDEMEGEMQRHHYFYLDDGGFRASHEDERPGDVIYYLGIIDCLTHYGAVKRIEHFYKSLRATESQISPIPPDRYGDRFVRFISGITKSPELAAQEATEKAAHSSADAETSGYSSDQLRRSELVRSPTDKVMQGAERQAERSSRELDRSERIAPNRELSTTRSTSIERGDGVGFTLPVVEEAAESASTGGRSGISDAHPSISTPQLQFSGFQESDRDDSKPPPTPPKDDHTFSPSSSLIGRNHHTYDTPASARSSDAFYDCKSNNGISSASPTTRSVDNMTHGIRRKLVPADVDKDLPAAPAPPLAPPPPPAALPPSQLAPSSVVV